jgi:hypothetical protein
MVAYGQSKTANVLFAVELTRRWSGEGITANALMPGAIMTNLARHMDAKTLESLRALPFVWKTPEQGAATTVLLAASPRLAGIGGRYFEDCNEAEVLFDDKSFSGLAPCALDPEGAERLWEASIQMLGDDLAGVERTERRSALR